MYVIWQIHIILHGECFSECFITPRFAHFLVIARSFQHGSSDTSNLQFLLHAIQISIVRISVAFRASAKASFVMNIIPDDRIGPSSRNRGPDRKRQTVVERQS